MQQKNKYLNFLPYLIVLIAIMSLFSLNGGSGTKTLSYSEMQDVIEKEDIKEFYLGMSDQGRKSFRDVRSYRRRKRWLA